MKPGTRVMLIGKTSRGYAAIKGEATGVVEPFYPFQDDYERKTTSIEHYVRIKWDRNLSSDIQFDGLYPRKDFEAVEVESKSIKKSDAPTTKELIEFLRESSFNAGRDNMGMPCPKLKAAADHLEEQSKLLFLFREFYSFYVTQSKIGSSHHHPIWGDIACILDGADLNHNRMTDEEYQYITGPYFDYYKIREQNEDLFNEEEE